ncbi:MAG: cupredoxin domain-containing protein [Candidatus Kerfeldbacteria bacterium]|nr:cupredoxin domain-containing protein [Candidatus Kerfeldbacteria bacterium]
MHHKLSLLALGLMSLTIIGAGCHASTTGSIRNTNITVGGGVNVSVNAALDTNSVTTGSFTTGQAEQGTTVTITASGVDPQVLTVKKGTTVTFVNNDAALHRLASNPHPADTDLPGFDGTIPPNDRYTFTFTKVGRWGYHDHLDALNPTFQGTIVVQE